MRAYEFVIEEDWSRVPKISPEHKARLIKQQQERQKLLAKRDQLLPIMYAREDPIEAELRKIDLEKQRLELRQLEVEIEQTRMETATEQAELQNDGMEAVCRMAKLGSA